MITLKCNLSGKQFTVKKICKRIEMPKNTRYWDTVYTLGGIETPIYNIYRTDSGTMYAKEEYIR